MSLISCNALSAAYEGRRLFDNVSLSIHEGDRIGLIGANGAGKSTLLRQLMGTTKPDSGERAERKMLRKGYVPQDPRFEPGMTVRQVLSAAHADAPLHPMETDVDRDVRVSIMLDRVGFADTEQDVQRLSGGWRKRLAIACALVAEPELVFFDEPTNHLDLDGILWIEELLARPNFAFVLISHDRRLLQSVAKRIIELDTRYPGCTLDVAGDYATFLERREDLLELNAKTAVTLENKVRNEIAYLKQGPKARTSKSQSRVDKALATIDELAEFKSRQNQQLSDVTFSATERRTKKLLVAEGLTKSLGGRLLFSDVNLTLSPGTRLGIVGENGSGKTTLLRVLEGSLAPDAGEIRQAPDLRIIYFDQGREQLDLNTSLRQTLVPKGDHVLFQGREVHVAGYARRFRFRPEQLDMPVGSLSGGEQAKVLIARLMLHKADVLILDEPTNDLDIHSLDVLQDGLLSFPGAVLLVTHDRFLMDAVAQSIIALDGNGEAQPLADLYQWQAHRQSKKAAAPDLKLADKPKPKRADRPRGLTYMEQKEYEQMEETILLAEEALAAASALLADPAISADADKIGEAYQQQESAQAQVDGLYARWAELEDKKNAT
jgi:ATP-binding cassette subfamily F protein uup